MTNISIVALVTILPQYSKKIKSIFLKVSLMQILNGEKISDEEEELSGMKKYVRKEEMC